MEEQRKETTMGTVPNASSSQSARKAGTEQICWFCKAEPPAVKEHWAGVHLEKVIKQSTSRQVSEIKNVLVPRCESCYRIHKRMTWVIRYSLIAFLGPIVLLVLNLVPADKNPWFLSLMEYIMVSGLAMAVIGTLLYHITFPKHTHRRNYEHQYPAVLEAKRVGYLAFWGRLFHM